MYEHYYTMSCRMERTPVLKIFAKATSQSGKGGGGRAQKTTWVKNVEKYLLRVSINIGIAKNTAPDWPAWRYVGVEGVRKASQSTPVQRSKTDDDEKFFLIAGVHKIKVPLAWEIQFLLIYCRIKTMWLCPAFQSFL